MKNGERTGDAETKYEERTTSVRHVQAAATYEYERM